MKFGNVRKRTLSHGPEVGVVEGDLVFFLARDEGRAGQRLEGAAARVGSQHHGLGPRREDVVQRLIPESFCIFVVVAVQFFVDGMRFK